MTDRDAIKSQDCNACGHQIGMDDFVVCMDGITSRTVTFHHRCVPQMTDVQKHYGTHLNPGHLGLVPKDLG